MLPIPLPVDQFGQIFLWDPCAHWGTFSDPKGVGQMFVSLHKCCQISFLWANLTKFSYGTPVHPGELFWCQKGLVRSFPVYLNVAKSASHGPIWPIFFVGPLCTLGNIFDAKRGWSEVSQSTQVLPNQLPVGQFDQIFLWDPSAHWGDILMPKGVGQKFVSVPKCCQINFLWPNSTKFFLFDPCEPLGMFLTIKVVDQMSLGLPRCCQSNFQWPNLTEFFRGTPVQFSCDHLALIVEN